MKRLALSAFAFFALYPDFLPAQTIPDFLPEDFGAIADDGLDDRAAIQEALNAAGAIGGGTVRLGPGDYQIQVVAANGYGGSSAYHGVTVPPGCSLVGAGPDLTHIILLAGNAPANVIGDGIINGGYQTALTDFGGGGGILVADFRIDTPDTDGSPTGNLIGFAHVDGAVVSNVRFGNSRAHALELNLSRNVTVEDCDFDGRHFGSSTLQFDIGLIGAKSLIPTGTVVSDVLVRRCRFTGRDDDSAYTTKVIELSHTNSNCTIHNIAFEDCVIEGLTHYGSLCVATDNPPSKEIRGLRFERCHFIGKQESPSLHGLLQLIHTETQIVEDITVRDCLFSGLYSKGVVLISSYDNWYGNWDRRHRILVEGNTFAPTLDRAVPYWNAAFRLLSVSSCTDVTIRRNHFEIPATAANLPPAYGVVSCMAGYNLDLRVEDNVFTWAHKNAGTAPMGGYLVGLWVPAYLFERNGVASRQRITGNTFLAPPDGIAAAIRMTTEVPTTSWTEGAPFTTGLVAGNFTTATGSRSPWLIHWDLSGAGDIGTVIPSSPERTREQGWYEANGASLRSLDRGNNSLPRVNAGKCGYTDTLPATAGQCVRLHGPLSGEGLLQNRLRSYSDSVYRGRIYTNMETLLAESPAEHVPGELCVIRSPLSVCRRENTPPPDPVTPQDGDGPEEPVENLQASAGSWVPLQSGLEQLDDNADADGDGLTTAQERALLLDPMIPDTDSFLSLSKGTGTEPFQVHFRCAGGPHRPRMSLLSSADLENWQVESSCQNGTAFSAPAAGTLSESASRMGREIILSSPDADRRFWKLRFDP